MEHKFTRREKKNERTARGVNVATNYRFTCQAAREHSAIVLVTWSVNPVHQFKRTLLKPIKYTH